MAVRSVAAVTVAQKLSSKAKIDRWFSLLPATPALSRPESGFISGVEDADAATLAEARNLLLQLGAKKKRRLLPIRFTRRKIVGTVAPISKKPSAGSTGKSGAGSVAKSGKTGNLFGSGGKGSNVLGSSAKTGKSSSAMGTFGSSPKSSTFGSNTTSSSTFVMGGKSSTSPTSKTPSFMPLGSNGKESSFQPKDKKSPKVPMLLGGKSTSPFASSPNKSYPSTSFPNPKKSKTTFGIIWLPGRKHNKKKDYVHVSHNDDGYKERSPSMYPHENNFMSGDSPSHPFKKKEEDSNMLVIERPKGPIATAASAGAAVVAADDKSATTRENSTDMHPEDKQEKPEFTKQDKEETKEAAGDANFDDDKDSKSFLENESNASKFTETKSPKDRGDKVDSVYLRPPPPHKVRSNTSTADDEDCGIKCLYYTLQCCDCVLM